MSKRRILFKGVVLFVLALSLVPVPVLASPLFETRFASAGLDSAAGASMEFAGESVQLRGRGPQATQPVPLFPAVASVPGQSAGDQLVGLFPDVIWATADDGAVAASAILQPAQQHVLTVTKTVEWSGIVPDAGQQFTICVEGPTHPISDCQPVGHTGGTLSWGGLRSGVYTVTENYPGDEWDVTIVGSPVTFRGHGDATIPVTNTRKLGSLAVAKAVEWNGVTPDAGQQFTICVQGPSHPVSDCQTVGYTGGTLLWDDLIPGDYTVSESDPGSVWDVAIVGSPATVPEDGEMVTATVTNTRKLGSLAVEKVVEWNDVTPDAGQQFTICVEGPTHPVSDCQTIDHDGGTLVWSDLMPGVYTATETSPGSAWDVAIAGSPATVPEDGEMVTATVTNTRKLGSLAVEKVVEWNDVTPDAGQQFTICVEGPTHPVSDCQTIDHDGGTLVWSDLVPGVYTATETSPGSAWDVAIAGSPATVPEDGGMASANVTNTRRLGSLAVTKVVEWNDVTPDIGQRFVICIQGPSHPAFNCQEVGYIGGTLAWNNLIPGEYTVAEFSPGDEWDMVISGSPAMVPEDGGMATATVTNTRKLGSLAVTKVVDWHGVTPDLRQHFTICIQGASHPSGDCQTVSYTGGMLSWDDLIPGDYIITEVDPGDEWDVTIENSPAAVPEDGGSVGVTVTNTRRLGSLAVTKVVDWHGIAPDVSQQFTICIAGLTYPAGDCQTIGYIGGTLSWDDLIPGDYAVTEIDPGDEWFVELTGSPAAVPADGGSASAVVTNTRQLGWVRVTKVVDWGLARPDASKQFTICIAGPSYPGGDCRTLGHSGGILSWDELIPGDYVVTESDPGDSWEVEGEGSPAIVPKDGTGVSVTISNHYGGSTIYLPLMVSSFVDLAPDLVVDDILVTSDSGQVVIRNQGDGPVLPSDAFWVDLYIDPDPIPTAVNQTWENLCDQGIAWGVTAPALPLEPGGVLTLTIGDAYHWESYSYFPGALPPGTPIYVQVDSADVQTTYGAVLERHEILGDPYNNIAGPVPSTGGVPGAVQRHNPRIDLRDRLRHLIKDLPSRP